MYHALYRKWRPLTFDDVISQPHITTTLKNQIASGNYAHAYLFTGSRGTGKTTCARILSKAVNCHNPKDGNPCLECEICQSADKESLSDIIEIDAASNTGVDDIRSLKESAEFMPEQCTKKVYIIDEVHMLSNNAFNALLKLLEEPPEYDIFILATTEIHKVPETIISRCQRFDFRRIKTSDIVSRIKYIASEENINISDEAAILIARISNGGMRDALSILDQCVAYSNDVSLDTVSAAAGIAGREYLFNIIKGIFSGDTAKVLEIVNSLYDMSKDLQRLCDELLEQIRNLMLIKAVPNNDLISCLPDELNSLKEIADKNSMNTILSKIEILKKCNDNMSKSNNKRLELEMCVIKLTVDTSYINVPTSAPVNAPKTVQATQPKFEQAVTAPPVQAQEAPPTPPAPVEEKAKEAADPVQLAESKEQKPKGEFMLLDCWSEFVEKVRINHPMISSFLKDAKAYVRDNQMMILTSNKFFTTLFKENSKSISEELQDFFGKQFRIAVKCTADITDNSTKNSLNKVDELIEKAKQSNIEIEKL